MSDDFQEHLMISRSMSDEFPVARALEAEAYLNCPILSDWIHFCQYYIYSEKNWQKLIDTLVAKENVLH